MTCEWCVPVLGVLCLEPHHHRNESGVDVLLHPHEGRVAPAVHRKPVKLPHQPREPAAVAAVAAVGDVADVGASGFRALLVGETFWCRWICSAACGLE